MTPAVTVAPGIYWDMPASVYHSARALSNGGLSTLEISPYQYWYTTINPDRPEPPNTPEMRLGSALHAAVLEEQTFLDRYAVGVSNADFADCIDTIPQIKQWLVENGGSVKGPNKPDLITEAYRVAKSKGATVRILDKEKEIHLAGLLSRGITPDRILDKVEWERVNKMARALLQEDNLKPILGRGKKEVSIFVIDPETGVLMKCRIDWLQEDPCSECGGDGTACFLCRGIGTSGGTVLDLKSMSLQGRSVDAEVIRALRFRGYIRQAWFYRYILKLAGRGDFRWVNAFVQSDAPYEVRLRQLGPVGVHSERYWGAIGTQTMELIRTYAEYCEDYGDVAWLNHQKIVPLRDSEVPGLAFHDYEGK